MYRRLPLQKHAARSHTQLASNLLEGCTILGLHQATQTHHTNLRIVWIGVDACLELCYALVQNLQTAWRSL